MSGVTHLIVPAAGLGTRLRPLTDATSKEMLPLGGRPILVGAFLEASAAGIERVTVVVHPRKEDLTAWIKTEVERWPFVLETVVQPEPSGALDAVRRGRGQSSEPCAVIYPDMLAPRQEGLLMVLAAHGAFGGCVLGAQRVTVANLTTVGRTGRFVFEDAESISGPRVVARVQPQPRELGAWHSVFAEVRTPAFFVIEERLGVGDEHAQDIYNTVAADGRLRAADLSATSERADILDTGTMAGYQDAVARFDDGRWSWRA